MPKYKVLVGCNYPPDDTRAEPGDVIDVPEEIGKALIRHSAAKPYKAPRSSKSTTTTSAQPSQAQTGKEG